MVGYDHDVKGQGIYAYVTLNDGVEYTDALKKELVVSVREQIGAFAAPDVIHWAPGSETPRIPEFWLKAMCKGVSYLDQFLCCIRCHFVVQGVLGPRARCLADVPAWDLGLLLGF